MLPSTKIKRVLGELPLTAELDWALRGRRSAVDGFKLEELKKALPDWCRQVKDSPLRQQAGKKVLTFATLHYWINHSALLSLALAGMGHEVTFAYLPYANWKKEVSKFDLRRRQAYAHSVLKPAEHLIRAKSLLDSDILDKLPTSLADAVEQVSIMDTQYTLQIEEVDKNKVNRFKTLVQSNNVDDEDIKIFFRWFESFIYIAEKYKKLLDN